MKCKFCREELPEGAKVCPTCGTPVEQGAPEEGRGTEGSENSGQTSFQYGQYGMSGQGNGQSAPQDRNSYQYGAPNQGSYDQNGQQGQQNPYQYGAPNQGGYGQSAPQGQQNPYQYGAPNQGGYDQNGQQGTYQYGAPNQGNYGQPVKEISGTPYMVFAILTLLFCCMPLGIAAIVFASKINSLQKAGDYAGAQDAAKKAKICTIIGAVGGAIVLGFSIFALVSSDRYDRYDEPSFSSSVLDDYEDEDEDDVTDIEDEEDDEDADADEKAKAPAVPASGELGDTWNTYTVQINDKVVTLPCTVADIEAAGLTLDTDDTPEDYVINGREYEYVYFENESGSYIMVDAINLTEQAKTVKECMIGGISVHDYSFSQGGLTVIFPGGIQIGGTKEDMLAKYGETDDVYEGDSLIMYTWSAEDSYYSSCDIDLDAETGLITSISLQNYGE